MSAIFRRKPQDRDLVGESHVAIEALNRAKRLSTVTWTVVVYDAIGDLLVLIKVGFPSARVGWPLDNLNRNP